MTGITLWGRNGHDESIHALGFLRRHGFAAVKLLDLDRQPPTPEQLEKLRLSLGGTTAPLASTGIAPPDDTWFHVDSHRFRAPILLTPQGALVGFHESAWARFFEVKSANEGA